jgi:hypothetical protein
VTTPGLERLLAGSREENETQFTSSRFLETLGRLGIMQRRIAYHHPEGNSYTRTHIAE